VRSPSIDLLAERDVHLGEPRTRQLRRELRELRFYLGRERVRITYSSPRAGASCF